MGNTAYIFYAAMALVVVAIIVINIIRSKERYLSDYKSFIYLDRTFEYRRFSYYATYTGRSVATKFYENRKEIFTLWIDIEDCQYSKDHITTLFSDKLTRHETIVNRCKEIKSRQVINCEISSVK